MAPGGVRLRPATYAGIDTKSDLAGSHVAHGVVTMAKIRTVEKMQAQLTGAESANRKHKAENDALRKENATLLEQNRTLQDQVTALMTPPK